MAFSQGKISQKTTYLVINPSGDINTEYPYEYYEIESHHKTYKQNPMFKSYYGASIMEWKTFKTRAVMSNLERLPQGSVVRRLLS